MVIITEVSKSYREEPGDIAEAVVKLEAQGWQVARRQPGRTILSHPEMQGHIRMVEASE